MKEQQASPLSVLGIMGRRDFINIVSSETGYRSDATKKPVSPSEDKVRTIHCFREEAETIFCRVERKQGRETLKHRRAMPPLTQLENHPGTRRCIVSRGKHFWSGQPVWRYDNASVGRRIIAMRHLRVRRHALRGCP